MQRLTWVVEIVGQRGDGQDRAKVIEREGEVIVVLADGAGGTGNGARAAEAIVEAAGRAATWEAMFEALERGGMAGGQATAVVMRVRGDRIEGTSVGDSEAWLVGDEIEVLTERQVRKPLVGAGCVPVAFGGALGGRTLVVGSDGLFKYARAADIARIARGPELAAAAKELVQAVRLPNGELQDDVSIVLVRAA